MSRTKATTTGLLLSPPVVCVCSGCCIAIACYNRVMVDCKRLLTRSRLNSDVYTSVTRVAEATKMNVDVFNEVQLNCEA